MRVLALRKLHVEAPLFDKNARLEERTRGLTPVDSGTYRLDNVSEAQLRRIREGLEPIKGTLSLVVSYVIWRLMRLGLANHR